MFASFLLAIVASGCGSKNRFIDNVDITTYSREDGHVFIEVNTRLNTGKVSLPAFSYSIHDRANYAKIIGTLSVKQVAGGGNDLSLAYDLSEVADSSGWQNPFLPNGQPLPVSVPNDIPIWSFPIRDSNIMTYLAIGDGVGVFGAAITVREFYELGKTFGDLTYFPQFDLGNGIRGVAGIFLSDDPTKNGFALFVDGGQRLAPNMESRAQIRSELPPAKTGRELNDSLLLFEQRHKGETLSLP